MKQKIGWLLERLGFGLLFLGGLSLAAIILIVFINGSWPDFLEPVRSRWALMHAIVGPFSYIVSFGVFLLPGCFFNWATDLVARNRGGGEVKPAEISNRGSSDPSAETLTRWIRCPEAVAGVSAGPIDSTFEGDTSEHGRLTGFFAG